MKANWHKTVFISMLLLIGIQVSGHVLHRPAGPFNWTGAVSTAWGTAGNWSTGTVPGSSDKVTIGLVSFTNQPAISANTQVAAIVFGGETAVTLTVNSGDTLRVATITQSHAANNVAPKTTLTGNGSVICSSMTVGNDLLPKVIINKTTQFVSNVNSLAISDSLVISSSTIDLLSGGLAHNNSVFSLEGGVLKVTGKIRLENFLPAYLDPAKGKKPFAKFMINITSSQNATLAISDPSVFVLQHMGQDSIDFYHYVTGSGKSLVNYTGGSQLVYTNNAAGLDTLPYTYQNLSVTASGTKTAGASSINNRLNIGGNLNITAGTLDFSTYSPTTTITGNFNNYGTINFGSAKTTFLGSLFFNAGGFVPGSGVLQFSGGTQTLNDSTATGTNFRKVTFNHPGTKSMQTGKFNITSDGKVRMSDTAALSVNIGTILTFRADSTGSAVLAALIQGCTVSGLARVEQYIQGSLYLHNTSLRQYRLISSAVYTGTDATSSAHIFDIDYMINSLTSSLTDIVLISGLDGTTNGFNVNIPANLPSMYAFREDDPPPPTGSTPFTTQYNWKGIAKINNSPVYNLGTQKFLTTTNLADTTTTLPVANGLIFYFRGNAVFSNGTTTGDKVTSPFNYPEDVTMVQRGTLNTGDIKVRVWFANSANNLGNNLSFTAAHLTGSTSLLKGGFNLVGNPYPAPINWDNLSTSDSTSSIYGPNLMGKIYVFNPVSNQYNNYTADASHDRMQIYHGTGIATNVIGSAVGFFVVVDSASANPHAARLTFRETAKFDPDAGSSAAVFAANDPQQHRFGKHAPQNLIAAAEQEIRLKLVPELDTARNDDILITFKKEAHNTYNDAEDGFDLGGSDEAAVALSSYSEDHVKLAINKMPLPPDSGVIGLYSDAKKTGDYRLDLTAIKNIPDVYAVHLKDKMTGKEIDLRRQFSYAFRIDKARKESYGDRFELLITRSDRKDLGK